MRLLLATALALLLMAAPASAAIFNVNTTTDTRTCDAKACSLRGALLSASGTNERDTINLVDLSGAPYQVSLGEIQVPPDVEIFGLGADLTTIAGDGKSSRVFRVAQGPQVWMANLTISGGAALTETDPAGGNVLVAIGGNLLLDHVRITRGVALRGGGIAALGGVLEIRHSLIDNNEARASQQTTPTGDGGGILSAPQGAAAPGVQTLTISDSTIAFNTADVGAGVLVRDNPNGATTLTRVTVAYNTAPESVAGGIGVTGSRAPDVAGSIIADNVGQIGRLGGPNCAGVPPVDGGGNLESGTDCGFTGSGSRQNPSTGLATALVSDGGMLPVLPISADSPARELAGACTGTDQRDVTRPQGALCDAGAYEYLPPPPPEPITPRQVAPTPTPAPTATPTPEPTPVVNQTVVVQPVAGKIRIRLPKSKKFVELDAALGIPTGSTVDARKGRVRLASVPKAGAPVQTAVFYAGIFRVTQKRGITDLKLTEKLRRCGKRTTARAAAKKAKRPKKRRLWGNGKGAFRTTGRYSAATVRGTKWLVQDSCKGTLTRVKVGSVKVRDKVRKRTKVVRAGKRYLARPKR